MFLLQGTYSSEKGTNTVQIDETYLETEIYVYSPHQLCCIFSFPPPDKASLSWHQVKKRQVLFRLLVQIFTEKCSEKYIVFESDFERKDIRILNVCPKGNLSGAVGHFAKELGHDAAKVDHWLSLIKDLIQSKKQEIVVPYVLSENGQLFDTTIHLIETLENGNVITMHIFKETTGN